MSSLATSSSELPSFAPGRDDEEQYDLKSDAVLEKMEPNASLTASLLAIKMCSGAPGDEIEIRDSPAMGFVYVAEVDETKKRIRFLAPHPQRWGDRALMVGNFPEAVPDLIA